MAPVNRMVLSQYLAQGVDQRDAQQSSALGKALKLFLVSNLIDNTDLLDNNVPFDKEVNRGQSIFEQHKMDFAVDPIADVLYDRPKSEVLSIVKQWLQTGWINEQDCTDIEKRLNSENTMEKVVIEKVCDQKTWFTLGYVVYFDLTLVENESSCALIYAFLKFGSKSDDGRRLIENMAQIDVAALLAYMKFKMYKHFYDVNDPKLLKLKAEARDLNASLPADVKNYKLC